jgi:REP element-mobilizing transposase RayT
MKILKLVPRYMTNKYQNKYRISSARHPHWDYGQNASYFITICTKNREHLFGTIENQMMIHSALGNYAYDCWFAIPQHFPFVRLGVFVVMPNHVHGIIIIDKNNGGTTVETQYFASLPQIPPPQLNIKSNKFGPQSQNLASVVRGYKTGVTKMAQYGGDKTINGDNNDNDGGDDNGDDGRDAKFCVPTGLSRTKSIWQPRYHDHIIRNADEYKRIETYIINNPARWEMDKFYNGQ